MTNQPPLPKKTKPKRSSDRGRSILLMGVPGIGKTCLAAMFPNTYWVIDPMETGIYDLIDSGLVEVEEDRIHTPLDNFNSLLALNAEIKKNPGVLPAGTKTIVYESMMGFEKFCHDTTCIQSFNGNWDDKQGGFMFFQKGYEIAANQYWYKFIKQLSDLRELGYNIILTGHTDIRMQKNTTGLDYMVETAATRHETWKVTHGAFENVIFYSLDVIAERDNKFARAKVSTFCRTLHVTKTPYCDAKNRCGMFEDIRVEGKPNEVYLELCRVAKWDPKTLRYL